MNGISFDSDYTTVPAATAVPEEQKPQDAAPTGPDMPWVYRELASLSEDLEKAADSWEPPTARSLLAEMRRIVRVLQELHPEPDPWG